MILLPLCEWYVSGTTGSVLPSKCTSLRTTVSFLFPFFFFFSFCPEDIKKILNLKKKRAVSEHIRVPRYPCDPCLPPLQRRRIDSNEAKYYTLSLRSAEVGPWFKMRSGWGSALVLFSARVTSLPVAGETLSSQLNGRSLLAASRQLQCRRNSRLAGWLARGWVTVTSLYYRCKGTCLQHL